MQFLFKCINAIFINVKIKRMKQLIKFTLLVFATILLQSFNIESSIEQIKIPTLYLGKNYTFCFENISLTLFDGGAVSQIRYGSNRIIINNIKGEWTAYGAPSDMPGQTIKIKFTESSIELSYTLIRNGSGEPSVLIDGTGRRYQLCKSEVANNNQPNSSAQDYLKNSFNNKNPNLNLDDFTIVENLVVMNNDISTSITNWQNAKSACDRLGEGWRLPTQNDLSVMYRNKDKIKNLSDGAYWSSTTMVVKESEYRQGEGAWTLNFANNSWGGERFIVGEFNGRILENLLHVRAVRDKMPNDLEKSFSDLTKSDHNENSNFLKNNSFLIGTYKSLNPSLSEIEFKILDNEIVMHLTKKDGSVDKMNLLKNLNDTCYFLHKSENVNRNIPYKVVFIKPTENKKAEIKIIYPKGQIINAFKLNVLILKDVPDWMN